MDKILQDFFLVYKRSAYFDILKELSYHIAKEIDEEIMVYLLNRVDLKNHESSSDRNILGDL